MVFIKEPVLDQILLEYLMIEKEYENRSNDIITKYLENETSKFLFRFKRALEKNNQLRSLENLYDFTEKMREVYQECIQVFQKNADTIKDETVKEILAGAITILENSLEYLPDDEDNMITLERVTFVSTAITGMKMLFQEAIALYLKNQTAKGILEFNTDHILPELLKDLLETNQLRIKSVHESGMKNLNQYGLHTEAQRYALAISESTLALQSLNAIDLNTVQEKVEDHMELSILLNVIQVIQEIYKKMSDKEQEIFKSVNGVEFSMETIQSAFRMLMEEESIEECASEDEELLQSIEQYMGAQGNLKERLYHRILDDYKRVVSHHLGSFKKESDHVHLVSCQVIEAFKEALYNLRQIRPKVSQPEDLADKILSSLSIKFDSLKEQELDYALNLKEIQVRSEKEMEDFKRAFFNRFTQYFEELTKHQKKDGMLEVQNRFERLLRQFKEQYQGIDIEYMKNSLFFEINTFEEIIKHSLPKMKEQNIQNAIEIETVLTQLQEKLIQTIGGAGIGLIEPGPHEKFNGKLHEVLMVEENEAYAKGEIIHLQSKGYLYKDQPLVRAQVIVAK